MAGREISRYTHDPPTVHFAEPLPAPASPHAYYLILPPSGVGIPVPCTSPLSSGLVRGVVPPDDR